MVRLKEKDVARQKEDEGENNLSQETAHVLINKGEQGVHINHLQEEIKVEKEETKEEDQEGQRNFFAAIRADAKLYSGEE